MLMCSLLLKRLPWYKVVVTDLLRSGTFLPNAPSEPLIILVPITKEHISYNPSRARFSDLQPTLILSQAWL